MKTRTKRMPKPRRVAMITKAHRCTGGPWDGHTIYLDAFSDSNSGWFTIAGEVGRYRSGTWEPMATEAEFFQSQDKAAEQYAREHRDRMAA